MPAAIKIMVRGLVSDGKILMSASLRNGNVLACARMGNDDPISVNKPTRCSQWLIGDLSKIQGKINIGGRWRTCALSLGASCQAPQYKG